MREEAESPRFLCSSLNPAPSTPISTVWDRTSEKTPYFLLNLHFKDYRRGLQGTLWAAGDSRATFRLSLYVKFAKGQNSKSVSPQMCITRSTRCHFHWIRVLGVGQAFSISPEPSFCPTSPFHTCISVTCLVPADHSVCQELATDTASSTRRKWCVRVWGQSATPHIAPHQLRGGTCVSGLSAASWASRLSTARLPYEWR